MRNTSCPRRALAVGLATVVWTTAARPSRSELPNALPIACEERLALSAAPEHLREKAGLWVLGAAGYEQVRESRNGFTCLVHRDDRHSLKPVCHGEEGTRTVVPKILAIGAWLREGLSDDEIRQRVDRGFAEGTFRAPERPGVAYMLSHYNRPWDPAQRRLGWYPPHVMFLAPHATNAEVGFAKTAYDADPVMPLVAYEGPHGMILARQELQARPWEHPVPECPSWVMGRHGELPPEARQFDFWLGRWDVNLRVRADDGDWPASSHRAVAEIYPILDGKAVLELWDSERIKGYSLRYFDASRDEWILWLNWPGRDSAGSSSLSGRFHHGRGDFFSEGPTQDGGTLISRYSFNDITPTSLRWDDAYSSDGGKTWEHQWRMEFSRIARTVQLDAHGGDAHTFDTGQRCTLPEFGRFEPLAGAHSGTLRVRHGDQWREAPAHLTGFRALDGCAVLAFIDTEIDGAPFGSFHHLTWNTYASLFEETALDSRPGTPAEIFYGAAEGQAIELAPREGQEEAPSARRRWVIGDDSIELRSDTEGPDGSWTPTLEASFSRAPRR